MRQKTFYPVFLWSLVGVIALAAGMYMLSGLASQNSVASSELDESDSQGFYTLQAEDGTELLQSSWPMQDGDHFLSTQNQWYQVEKNETGTPTATPIAPPHYFQPAAWSKTPTDTSLSGSASSPEIVSSALIGPNGEERDVHVVIYHTHSDESYGYGTNVTSEPGNGDVFEVGERLSESLRTLGASVTHSYATHDPHDKSAYERSRETLLRLLPEQPDLVIDLHRDSAPVDSYVTTINGQLTARVMLVVGAANPNMETNLRYAYAFKEIADEIYPNLVRGIYIGKGSYNQDLYPSAMLMEFGTEGMSRDTAEKSAACITDILQTFLIDALPYLVETDQA